MSGKIYGLRERPTALMIREPGNCWDFSHHSHSSLETKHLQNTHSYFIVIWHEAGRAYSSNIGKINWVSQAFKLAKTATILTCNSEIHLSNLCWNIYYSHWNVLFFFLRASSLKCCENFDCSRFIRVLSDLLFTMILQFDTVQFELETAEFPLDVVLRSNIFYLTIHV